jgi:hypothetical protein
VSTPLTTTEEISRLLSAAGMIAFADHNQDGNADTGVLEDVISQASSHVHAFLDRQYQADLIGDDVLAREWATIIAAYKLCFRRGCPPPESLAVQYLDVTGPNGPLRQIADKHKWGGRLSVPRKRGTGLGPTFSNLVVDRRHDHEQVRVTSRNSDNQPTLLEQDQLSAGVIDG